MDHQFILAFYRSFKDNENIYFLTEFIPGFELFDAIRVIGNYPIFILLRSPSKARCTILHLSNDSLDGVHPHCALHCVQRHQARKCYGRWSRLLETNWYGYSQNTEICYRLNFIFHGIGGSNKTFTIIGTPHYMAPEVISGKGYNYMADLWSVGNNYSEPHFL